MDDQGVAGGVQDIPMGAQTSSGVLDTTGGEMPQMTEANGTMPPVVNNGAPMPEMGTAVLPPAPAPQVDEMTMPGMSGGTDPLAATTEALGTDAAGGVAATGVVSESVSGVAPEVATAPEVAAVPGVAVENVVGVDATAGVGAMPGTDVAAGAAPVAETMAIPGLENLAGGDAAASAAPEAVPTEQVMMDMENVSTGGEATGVTDELAGAAADLAGAAAEMASAETQANMQEVNQATPTPSMVESAQPAATEPAKEKKKFDLGGLFKKKDGAKDGASAGGASTEGSKEGKQSFSEWFENATFSDLFKPKQKNVSGIAENFEINLVPSVKAEALAAMHMRNLILFICIIVVASMGGLVAVLGSIHGAKSIQMSSQDSKLDAMSEKINSFDGLEEYLTIQEQLNGIATINENRQVLSRIFPFLAAMQPDAPDSVTFSEMSIDMETNTVRLEGKADAGVEPLIDYRVLEAFKKSTEQMTYDYGNYVDKEGNEIPMRCMVENGANGETLVSGGATYAYWMVTKNGCDVTWNARVEAVDELENDILVEEAEAKAGKKNKSSDEDEEGGEEEEDSNEGTSGANSNLKLNLDLSPNSNTNKEEEDTDLSLDVGSSVNNYSDRYKEVYDEYNETVVKTWYDGWLERVGLTRYTDNNLSEQQIENREASWNDYYEKLSDEEKWMADKMVNENGVRKQDVYFEKIYRTPLFEEWSRENENGEVYMTTSGEISGIPHFQSKCNTYTGIETGDEIKWVTSNECKLVDGEMEIASSSNGRSDGNLVLQFEASFTLNKEPMNFNNKHVMAIAPSGKNVTDSYVQVEGMFGKAAEDCQSTDVVCTSNKQNKDGGNNAN